VVASQFPDGLEFDDEFRADVEIERSAADLFAPVVDVEVELAFERYVGTFQFLRESSLVDFLPAPRALCTRIPAPMTSLASSSALTLGSCKGLPFDSF
jgi:hypothetical protein